MLQGEHSAILLTFIKLPFVINIFVLSIFEWQFYTGFTVMCSVSLIALAFFLLLPLRTKAHEVKYILLINIKMKQEGDLYKSRKIHSGLFSYLLSKFGLLNDVE